MVKEALTMGEGDSHIWVYRMAEHLVSEITEEMAGIQMWPQTEDNVRPVEMDTVWGFVNGDFQMEVQFRAQPCVFYRMASNIIGGEPEGPEEVREYAVEYFNVLCGRFVSELSRTTHVPARFRPPEYTSSDGYQRPREPQSTLYFLTDKNEQAAFSWSEQPMEQLLKRSGMQ
jgi:hypothetical protein